MWVLSSLLENAFVKMGMVDPGQDSPLYTIAYGLLGFFLALTIFCIYYGLWFGPKQSLRQLNPMTVIVTDKQCAYKNLATAFEQMMKELKELGATENARNIGIYLDNPTLVKEEHMCRCMLGYILASPLQQEIGEKIAQRSHRYRIISLPSVQAVHLAVPFRNVITYFLMGFFWGSIKIPGHLNASQYSEKQMAAIEIYSFTNPSKKEIHLYMPVGRYSEYIKSAFPRPDYYRSTASIPDRSTAGYSRAPSESRSRPVSRGRSQAYDPQQQQYEGDRRHTQQGGYQGRVSESPRSNPYTRAPSQRTVTMGNGPRPTNNDPLEQFRMSHSSPVASHVEYTDLPSPRRSQTLYKSEFY